MNDVTGLTIIEQRNFVLNGYVVLKGFVNAESLHRMTREIDVALVRSRLKKEAPSPWTVSPVDSSCDVGHADVLSDIRLTRCVELLLGTRPMPVRFEMSERTGNIGWHTDVDPTQPILRGVNVIIYFDKLRGENGALRVVPGSHVGEMASALHTLAKDSNREMEFHLPHLVLSTDPGDVIVFSMALWHSSFGGDVRKLVSASFWPVPGSDADVDLLRKELIRIRASLRAHFGYPFVTPIRAKNSLSGKSLIAAEWSTLLDRLGWR